MQVLCTSQQQRLAAASATMLVALPFATSVSETLTGSQQTCRLRHRKLGGTDLEDLLYNGTYWWWLMNSKGLTRGGVGKEGPPNLGGLGRLGVPILQEASKLRPQQLGGAGECGV